jgi:zinc/manganese transport system substrate-binding protein
LIAVFPCLCGVQADLNVVVTTTDLGALAEAVGGERVTVTALARPTEDPHFVDPKPSFVVRLNRADVLIEGGAGLEEGWLAPLLENARNPKVAVGGAAHVNASVGVQMLEVPEVLDRSLGDLHAAGNPHYLMDPLNARIVAANVAEALARLDPEGASLYRRRFESFSQRLDEKMEEWRRLLEPHQGRRLASYHNIWPYFARRFGLQIDLFLEPKPGIPPTPSSLGAVMSEMKQGGIKVILVEPFQNRRTAERVAVQTGARVVDVAQYPGAIKGAGTGYLELMDHLVRSVAEALGDGDRGG